TTANTATIAVVPIPDSSVARISHGEIVKRLPNRVGKRNRYGFGTGAYSCRSATAGSTRNARAVGATVARPATSASTHATATKFRGSVGRTSGTRNIDSGRTATRASATPIPIPVATRSEER